MKSSDELITGMNAALDAMSVEIEKGNVAIDKDRETYSKITKRILDFVKEQRLILSDVNVITGNSFSGIPLSIFSPRALQHSKAIADMIYHETKSMYVRQKTIIGGKVFVIEFDTIVLCTITQIMTPKGVLMTDLVNPEIHNGFMYLPAEIEMIAWCHERSLPDRYENWSTDEFSKIGQYLFSKVEQRMLSNVLGAAEDQKPAKISGGFISTGSAGGSSSNGDSVLIYEMPFMGETKVRGIGVVGGVIGGRSRTTAKYTKGKSSQKSKNIDMKGMMPLLKAICETGEAAVVGEYAYYVQTGAPGGDRARPQIVIGYSIEHFVDILKSQMPGVEIWFIEHETAIPKHSGFKHWIVYANISGTKIPIFEVYGFGEHEFAPCVEFKGIYIGSKWMSLRIMFITLWKLRILHRMKSIRKFDDKMYHGRLNAVWSAIQWTQESPEKQVRYFGVFVPEDIQGKISRHGAQMYRPYYPAAKNN
ncbi:MAG: hypothetical protein CMK92_05045 [Pseudomonas sp.]|nr:hypothetical protein [Pseudomonas sp.]